MKVSKNRFDNFTKERDIIRTTIKEKINYKSIPLLDWEDIEQELMVQLLKVKRIYDEEKYVKSIKSIVENKLKDLIRFYNCPIRYTKEKTISTFHSDNPHIAEIQDTSATSPESCLENDTSEIIMSAFWDIVKDKPKVYSDIVEFILRTGNTKIAVIAKELNIPRRTLRDKWANLKKWAINTGLNKII